MTKLDPALAAKLCAEAMEDDHGFEGRFFYDAERGDIGWIAKDCDDKQCVCEVKTNADGDQDCSHSLYDWEGEDHINEPIVRMLNRHHALSEQLMAAMEVVKERDETIELFRLADTDALAQRDAALREVERMRPVYEAAVRWRSGWPPNARVGGMTKDVADLFNAIDTALSQDKERP